MSVDYVLEDDLAIVTLNRPDRYNAIEASLSDGLIEAAKRAGRRGKGLVAHRGGQGAFAPGQT